MKKEVRIGKIKIGNGNRIAIQSMTNTDTSDFDGTLKQILELDKVGCDIVRLAVCSDSDVAVCEKIIKAVEVPLVADIQFDYKLAVKCAEIGFAKIRFNPGNIGGADKVEKIVDACKDNGVAIRIGVNSGSIDKAVATMFTSVSDALVESAMQHVRLLEKFGFYDTVISVKSSDVKVCVDAYRKLNALTDYPLHIGITESGGGEAALLKSAVGIGSLLIDGIGDTVRVSLSDNPVREVEAARKILRASGVDKDYCQIISCPTCSRCKYNLIGIVEQMQAYVKDIRKPLKIAIMGCAVNGLGEAADCDFGIAGGDGKAVLFEKGKIVKTIASNDVLSELKKYVDNYIK